MTSEGSPHDEGPSAPAAETSSTIGTSPAPAGMPDGMLAPPDPRRRRVRIAAVVGLAAVVAVAMAVALGSSGDRTGGASRTIVAGVELAGTKEARELLAGIAQDGTLLGDPSAPVTIHEFADLKCPACQRYEVEAQPGTITTLVRTGRANLRIHLMNVIDPGRRTTDGAGLINVAYGLAAKDRMWSFVHVLYYNQGVENREWATQARLRQIARGAPGVDPADVSVRETPATRAMAAGDRRLARRLGVRATPTVFVEPRGTDRFGLVPDPWNGLADAVDAATRTTPRRTIAR